MVLIKAMRTSLSAKIAASSLWLYSLNSASALEVVNQDEDGLTFIHMTGSFVGETDVVKVRSAIRDAKGLPVVSFDSTGVRLVTAMEIGSI